MSTLNNASGPFDIRSYWSTTTWPKNVENLGNKISSLDKEID